MPTTTIPIARAARIRPWIGLLLAIVALTFLGLGIARDASLLGGQRFTVRPIRLIAGTVAEVALLAWGVFLWSRILACFDGAQPRYRALLRVWCGSTLAKYLPGSVWSVAATAGMASRAGISSVALPSSFLLHGALNVVGAIALAAVARIGAASIGAHVPGWLVASLVVGALVLVHPSVVTALVRCGARVARRTAPAWRGTWAGGALLFGLYVATWAAYGVAFALFLSGISPIGNASWVELAGINALAFAAGFVAFFAPGGIGVREAALTGLLVPFIPGLGARVAIAASSRLWLVLTEVAGGALIVGTGAGRWRAGTTSGSPRTDDALPAAPVPNANPMRPGRAQQDDTPIRDVPVELLTDTRAALVAITEACRRATKSIWIAQLAFDADCAFVPTDADSAPQPLLDTILDAAHRSARTGVPLDVRIVLNGGLLLDTSPALRRAIAAVCAGDNVRVRTLKAFPRVMHTKLLVVDGRDAFLMGASFVNGYWDSARHVAKGEPDSSPGAGERPLHDVAVRLQGAAAPTLAGWFAELWREARPTGMDAEADAIEAHEGVATEIQQPTLLDTVSATSAASTGTVLILRTSPPGGAARREGHREVLDGYLEAIARARECIYLESQYFSARPIARAVRDALDANAGLELILVLNQNPDITAYRAWQDARLAEHDLLDHPRVGVFALWSVASSRGALDRRELTQVFVHSKAAVIDDAWATIGTANLDGASLHSYGDDFVRWPGRRVFGRFRNYDLNVALLDGVDGEPRSGLAGALRRQLWARHLGVPAGLLDERPANGWLPLWRSCAAAHVTCLAAAGHPVPRGRVLPYVPRAHPRDQLRALGIDVDATGLDLRYDPGRLDALCNLGWMKKLLPERLRRWC